MRGLQNVCILRCIFEASKIWQFHGFGPLIKQELDEVHSRKTLMNMSGGKPKHAILKGNIKKTILPPKEVSYQELPN